MLPYAPALGETSDAPICPVCLSSPYKECQICNLSLPLIEVCCHGNPRHYRLPHDCGGVNNYSINSISLPKLSTSIALSSLKSHSTPDSTQCHTDTQCHTSFQKAVSQGVAFNRHSHNTRSQCYSHTISIQPHQHLIRVVSIL